MFKPYVCAVDIADELFYELILEYISKTPGIQLGHEESEILIVESNPDNPVRFPKVQKLSIILTSNRVELYSSFGENIADIIYKPDINYPRFLNALELAMKKLEENHKIKVKA